MGAYDSTGGPGIGARVRKIVSDRLFIRIEKIGRGSSFIENLGANSFESVKLIMDFEDEFGIDIVDEDADKILTVGEAISYIEKCLRDKEK